MSEKDLVQKNNFLTNNYKLLLCQLTSKTQRLGKA